MITIFCHQVHRFSMQSMAEREIMVTFKTSSTTYNLEKLPEYYGENAYMLSADNEFAGKILIMGITVECPDGNKKTLFRYSQHDVKGTADIAVADCACEYLEENFGK